MVPKSVLLYKRTCSLNHRGLFQSTEIKVLWFFQGAREAHPFFKRIWAMKKINTCEILCDIWAAFPSLGHKPCQAPASWRTQRQEGVSFDTDPCSWNRLPHSEHEATSAGFELESGLFTTEVSSSKCQNELWKRRLPWLLEEFTAWKHAFTEILGGTA